MYAVGKPQTLRLLNKDIIENIIRAQGPVSKPELSKLTGLSLVTVNKTVDALVAEERVLPAGMRDSGGGRNAHTYCINRRQYCFVALLLNDGVVQAALADVLGEPFAQETFAVDVADIRQELTRCIDGMLARAGGVRLMGIGVGVPGVVNSGVVTSIPAARALEGAPLADELCARYACDVYVENDLNLAAWGLFQRSYQGEAEHMALVYLERSVGCGLILGGQIFKGATSYAGEIGGFAVRDRQSGEENAFETEFLALRARHAAAADDAARDALTLKAEALIAKAVQNITCVVDTGLVAVKCSLLTAEGLARVALRLPMQSWHKPRLVLVGDMRADCLAGVINLCVHNATPAVSIAGWGVM